MCRDTACWGPQVASLRSSIRRSRRTHSKWRKGDYVRLQAHGIPSVHYRQPAPEAKGRHGPGKTVSGADAAIWENGSANSLGDARP